MSQTIDAIIDEHGSVRLLRPIQLAKARRALVTILDEPVWGETELEESYRAMAQDEGREAEALELSEATVGDVIDETR
jgi:hypothetical protein